MKTFFDTSAYAKRFINESGSDQIDEICSQTTDLGLSIICLAELISALNRRRRESILSDHDYEKIKRALTDEIKDVSIINITNSVVLKSIQLLENNTLRAMDALHLACALEWRAELFISADQRQIEAATREGLHAIYIA